MEIVPVNIHSKRIATQSNQLVESRYFLTIGEQKIILLLISMISPDDVDLKEYEMKVLDFAHVMGMTGHSVYERINDTLDRLLSRIIHIPKDTGYLKIGWISSAEYMEGDGTIRISFDTKLKPYLLGLKSQFTKYNLFIITQFKSSYTIRVYMLLKQYKPLGARKFSIVELRSILGINNGQYRLFKEFKRNVIMRAKREFETIDKETGAYKSDITFDLKTFRTGRKITDLKFIIKKQKIKETRRIEEPLAIKPTKESNPQAEINKSNSIPKTLSPVAQALSRHNISEYKAKTFEQEQGEEAVLNCVKLYEKQVSEGKVENKSGGYLISMLEAKAGIISQAEIETEQQKKEEQRLRILKQQEKRLEDYKHSVTVHFEREIKKQFLSKLSAQQKESLWQEIEPQLKYKIPTGLFDKGNELESPVVAVEINKRIPNYEERKANYINLKMAQKRQELFGKIDDF
jgi:plasmid replication initiation protein